MNVLTDPAVATRGARTSPRGASAYVVRGQAQRAAVEDVEVSEHDILYGRRAGRRRRIAADR